MSIVEGIFDTPLDRLPLERLLAFFDLESVETTSFESKSVADDRLRGDEYAEDVAAFLNTDGGVLVVGGPRMTWIDPANRAMGKRFEGSPTGHPPLARDSLRDSILGRIEPVPTGVRFQSWELSQGRQITIVEVPKSAYPPHQVRSRYLLRIDGATKPAPHGLVEALFLRRQSPHLLLEWDRVRGPRRGESGNRGFGVRIINRGNSSALDVVLEIYFPIGTVQCTHMPPTRSGGDDHSVFTFELNDHPIHPQHRTEVLSMQLGGLDDGELAFEAALFARDARGRYAAYRLGRGGPLNDLVGGREVIEMEEGYVQPSSEGFPYSAYFARLLGEP